MTFMDRKCDECAKGKGSPINKYLPLTKNWVALVVTVRMPSRSGAMA